MKKIEENHTSNDLSEKGMFYFQMQLVAADYLKTLTDYVLMDESVKKYVRQDIRRSMNRMNEALSNYSNQINRKTPIIGECGQFADTLIEFLNKATKNERAFLEVFGLMAAYNNGEINIVD